MDALGIYVSVPFCRSKCSYCNFASGVFSRAKMAAYVSRIARDIELFKKDLSAKGRSMNDLSAQFTATPGTDLSPACNSIYLGGGTPSTLDPALLAQLFFCLRSRFQVTEDAEITVECAPGTISEEWLQAAIDAGVNRISFGVQSFADQETRAVARLHTRQQALDDIRRVRAAGIGNINVDLIAGLPHQTAASWRESLATAIDSNVSHVSVYMLEVDEDSRLGNELLAGGARYHAHFVPDDDAIADFYATACDQLDSAGIRQYEISNFARPDFESRHNLKYWTRQPYLGFGLDAHSMLPADPGAESECVRRSTVDDLDQYLAEASEFKITKISQAEAVEEEFFLGLRLNRGVDLESIRKKFAPELVDEVSAAISDLIAEDLLQAADARVRLTARGRLLSNEVFARFIHVRSHPEAVSQAGEVQETRFE